MSEAAEKDLYAVLGASSSDSVHQLKHRYQQLALQYHPDRLGGEGSLEVESGVKKFLEVDAAWRILSDQNTRRHYDLQRRGYLASSVTMVTSLLVHSRLLCGRSFEGRAAAEQRGWRDLGAVLIPSLQNLFSKHFGQFY
ncbi:dnaJ homolog subfamily C member 24 isoform X2 [Acanthopagrus latus]|uniref:dnaJ homolog subfamily C member 24 isoform X2 n=1 Tax=Acanthopagrus latus TaxID=8177 RepID=UPI00187C05B8|nr:dnaJ homolog subfamily C member 24 isoform X2 [Acanthopagrus latus]